MKIDVHSHQIEEIFFDALRSLPGVTIKTNPDRFSYLLKDGKTWLPFRPEMFDPDHLIREMDRKGIDMSILSMNTPSVYVFEPKTRIDLARRLNDSIVARAKRNPDRVRGFATLPLPDVEASLVELERIKDAPGVVGIGVGSNFDGVALDDRRLEPVWARIAELGLPVSEHPMLPTFAEHLPGYALPIRVGFPFDTTLCVTRMIYGGVFERHPKLVVHRRAHRLGLHRPPGAARPRLPAVPRMPRAHHAAAERVRAQEPLLRHLRVLEIVHRDGGRRDRHRPLHVRHRLSLHHLRPVLYRGARSAGRGRSNKIFGGNAQRLFAQRLAI